MVVLESIIMRKYSLFLLVLTLFFLSCTKDRVIEVTPIVYPVEYWKKDSLVYTLYQSDVELNRQVTTYGISSPDTLTLAYETNGFNLTFLEGDKGNATLGSSNGLFSFDVDSLYLYGADTLRQRVVQKEDSLMILETSILNGEYLRQYRDYFQLLDINAEAPVVSFKNDIYEPIFYNNGEGRCMPCHNDDGGQMRLVPADLAYDELISGVSKNDGGVPYINTVQPEESYLYRLAIDDNVEYAMPPNSDLTPFEVETILMWIAQGAQNN